MPVLIVTIQQLKNTTQAPKAAHTNLTDKMELFCAFMSSLSIEDNSLQQECKLRLCLQAKPALQMPEASTFPPIWRAPPKNRIT